MISVIVCTTGRPSIFETIRSIQKSNYSGNFELIIVSQINKVFIENYGNVRYYHLDSLGLSKARNYGISVAEGEVICFTDDDCIVHENWLTEVEQTFTHYPQISATFGKTLAWREDIHSDKICPCTFTPVVSAVISQPCFHATSIGFGNNMAFKKKVFKKYGGFREWLGVNAIGQSAEDAEMALRLLTHYEKTYTNTKMVVFHDKWLTKSEFHKQIIRDIFGEFACYGAFAFRGYGFARGVLGESIKSLLHQLKQSINLNLRDSFHQMYLFIVAIEGLWVGWYYSRFIR